MSVGAGTNVRPPKNGESPQELIICQVFFWNNAGHRAATQRKRNSLCRNCLITYTPPHGFIERLIKINHYELMVWSLLDHPLRIAEARVASGSEDSYPVGSHRLSVPKALSDITA